MTSSNGAPLTENSPGDYIKGAYLKFLTVVIKNKSIALGLFNDEERASMAYRDHKAKVKDVGLARYD